MTGPGPGRRAVLSVIDAGCTVAGRRIFSGLTFEVREGERVHLDGPNGSGKTTVLRCVGGTMSLKGGRIRIGGAPAGSMRARTLTGLCGNPEQGLPPHLSGHDNLMFAARLRLPAREVDAAVEQVEGELGMSPFAGRAAHYYSAGMCARVTVARALLGRPTMLLIDEPTRSLDAEGRRLFWAAIDRRPDTACLKSAWHCRPPRRGGRWAVGSSCIGPIGPRWSPLRFSSCWVGSRPGAAGRGCRRTRPEFCRSRPDPPGICAARAIGSRSPRRSRCF